MNVEDYIIKIIKDTGLSRKELYNMVIQKNKNCFRAISLKKALLLIANELCVDLNSS